LDDLKDDDLIFDRLFGAAVEHSNDERLIQERAYDPDLLVSGVPNQLDPSRQRRGWFLRFAIATSEDLPERQALAAVQADE
jgi:hypothetical protein